MAKWLKQSTAVTLKIGPFLDETDGKTAETGLTISQADVRLSKNGGDIAQKNESTACTHDELGIYGCPIDTTDTGTLGRLQLWVHESGALPVWHEYMVVPANVWDSMFGADYLQTHLVEVTNNVITAAAINDGAIDAATFAAGAINAAAIADNAIDFATFAADCKTGSGLKANVESISANAITATAIAADAITAAKIADGAIDAGALAADCITSAKIADGAIAAEHIADNAIDFATFAADCKTGSGLKANVESISANAITATAIAADAITAAKVADGAIDAATFAADVDAEVAAYIWNAAAASYGGAGTYGQAVEDILVDTSTTLQGELDGIQADTEDIQTQIGVAGAGLTAVPWNAAWDAEVQSEVFDALNAEMTDATALTANGLLDRLRSVMWILRNKIEVTDANGNTVIYKDDSTTAGFTVNTMLTDDSTTTTRLRAA